MALLRHLFTKAIEWGIVEQNPVKRVKPYKENNQRTEFLSFEEIQKLIEACNDTIKPIITIAVLTGMRRGEILGLKWNDVDFVNKRIILLDTKNKERREIPMNDLILGIFQKLKDKNGNKSEYVFLTRTGDKLKDIRTAFSTALRKSEIKLTRPTFRFHDLRHTCASQMVMAGVDLATVREILGHKDIRITMRYSHLLADHKRKAIDKMTEKLSNYGQYMDSKVNILKVVEGSKPY